MPWDGWNRAWEKMIFSLFTSKMPAVPLEPGELIALRFPIHSAKVTEDVNPMTGEKIGSLPGSATVDSDFRTLFGAISKISKKRNIFLQFISKDKGEDLQVGMQGTFAVLKPKKLIEFPTTLLHRNEGTFIFSPPTVVDSVSIPSHKKGLVFALSCPINYRAASSPYSQRGTLTEFSPAEVKLFVNLLIPPGTRLRLEFVIPYRDEPAQMKGKVTFCEPLSDQVRKHLARVSLEAMSQKEKDDLLHYFLLSKQEWK